MNINPQYVSTTKLVKQHKISSSSDFFQELILLGLLTKKNNKYELTKYGVEIGGVYQYNDKNEVWVAWEINSLDKIIVNYQNSKVRKISNRHMLIIDNVELKYSFNNECTEAINIIVCTIKDEYNFYYEFNRRLEDNKVNGLIEKIKSKGIIDTNYWTLKNMDEYDNYDSDMNYSSNDDYDDYDNEDNDTDRLIDKVSNTLGYRVDEGLARAFIHDMSKL